MPDQRIALAILRADGLRMLRDRFLLGMAVLILGMCLALRLGIPWITRQVWERWAFDLEPYFPLLAGHISVVLPTVTVSILGGFMLLETREEQVIKALQVSPVPIRTQIGLLAVVMIFACVLVGLVHAAIISLALPPIHALVVLALLAGTAAPPQALFLAGISKNKVEAMAYTKVVSGAAPIALVAFFLDGPWQWLCGVYPPFWAAKAYWLAEAGDSSWPLWALGAPVASFFWWHVFSKLYIRSLYR